MAQEVKKSILVADSTYEVIHEIYYNKCFANEAKEVLMNAIHDLTNGELKGPGVSENFVVRVHYSRNNNYDRTLVINKKINNFYIKTLND